MPGGVAKNRHHRLTACVRRRHPAGGLLASQRVKPGFP
uniref:Uncharacterized protein n=1 Tax=Erwinia amylovora ATCC BAA-2158 TaxID=889211 RepID=E5B4C7_ERWAM|nr:hypothetical protein predicted by Glimmer/Critica [Erwinia amylovora ATCC BAA-2158]